MDKKILVTGGAGFIGSAFVHEAEKRNDKVIVLDALTYAANKENIATTNANLIIGNICDQKLIEDILFTHDIDFIVNFAAETHVDNSITGPSIFIESNICGTFSLLEAARKFAQNKPEFRYIQISTDEVYGSLDDDSKFSEETKMQPNSPYSASKAAGDMLVRAWWETYRLPAITTNCSNNYGPRQHVEKLIPKMISNALKGLDLPIYGNGKNIRDWIHVEDHVLGIYLAMEKGTLGETYCFGGDAEKRNIEIVTMICELLDELRPKSTSYKKQIKFVEDRAGHDYRYAINNSKAMRELGFKHLYDFNQGLLNTVKWYLENLND